MPDNDTPMEMLIDVSTGETVVRPIDPEIVETMRIEAEREATAKAEAAKAREALLDRIGLTAEEVKMLLS